MRSHKIQPEPVDIVKEHFAVTSPEKVIENAKTIIDPYPKIFDDHWAIIDYVKEEVSRQNHNILVLDGVQRVGWMLDAWSYAILRTGGKFPEPNLTDILNIGLRVERLRNCEGFRRANIRVTESDVTFPDFDKLTGLVSNLVDRRGDLSPIEFYLEFEKIHPFIDGNGRTGKILLNWLHGTLLEPVFPPNDLFGKWITNP